MYESDIAYNLALCQLKLGNLEEFRDLITLALEQAEDIERHRLRVSNRTNLKLIQTYLLYINSLQTATGSDMAFLGMGIFNTGLNKNIFKILDSEPARYEKSTR